MICIIKLIIQFKDAINIEGLSDEDNTLFNEYRESINKFYDDFDELGRPDSSGGKGKMGETFSSVITAYLLSSQIFVNQEMKDMINEVNEVKKEVSKCTNYWNISKKTFDAGVDRYHSIDSNEDNKIFKLFYGGSKENIDLMDLYKKQYGKTIESMKDKVNIKSGYKSIFFYIDVVNAIDNDYKQYSKDGDTSKLFLSAGLDLAVIEGNIYVSGMVGGMVGGGASSLFSPVVGIPAGFFASSITSKVVNEFYKDIKEPIINEIKSKIDINVDKITLIKDWLCGYL